MYLFLGIVLPMPRKDVEFHRICIKIERYMPSWEERAAKITEKMGFPIDIGDFRGQMPRFTSNIFIILTLAPDNTLFNPLLIDI